jgi:hypothetical protein
VGKIERFVVEQLRKFITEDFVYPSYHSIELLRAPAVPTPGNEAPDTTPNQPGVALGNPGDSRSVSSPAPSTNAASSTSASTHPDARDGHGMHRRPRGRSGEGVRRSLGSSGIPSRGSTSSSATNASRSTPSRSSVRGYQALSSDSSWQPGAASSASRHSTRDP